MVKESRTGGVMVKIPKFWFKWTKSGSTLKLQIADKAADGFSVSPAHMDRGDGKGERILTEGYHNEGPTWAPNGRVLMFFRDLGGGPALYTIDITGRNELKVPTPSFASDPAWSPLLS